MSDLNDLSKPTPTDTEPNVLDTLRAHIVRAATWSGWGGTANKVAGLMSATTAAVIGGRSLRLYRRNAGNTADEEVVSLPGVSVGGNAATASSAPWAGVTGKPAFFGAATATWADVTASRTPLTFYQNTSGRVLGVYIFGGDGYFAINSYPGGSAVHAYLDTTQGFWFLVPNGWYYKHNGTMFDFWREM